MVDANYRDATNCRGAILGDTTNDSEDTTFTRLGQQASRIVDGLISDVVDVPLTQAQYERENVQVLVTKVVQQLYYDEKKDYNKVRDDQLERLRKEALESVRKDLQTDPTDRATGPHTEVGSYVSPLIDEDDWNGTNSDSG